MNVPQWWLVLSGVFFGMFILLTLGLVWLVFILVATLRETTAAVKRLADRTDQIGQRIEGLVQRVDGLTSKVGSHADDVGGSISAVAQGLAHRADLVATGFMLLQTVMRMMSARRARK